MIAVLHETLSCNKGFELTHFYAWFMVSDINSPVDTVTPEG